MSVPATDPGLDFLGQEVKDGANHSDPAQIKDETVDKQDKPELLNQPQNGDQPEPSSQALEGVDDQERLEVIRQIEFYFSDANLPYDKFMFLQTSPHLDPVKAPNLTAEEKKKAEEYGPGCSPVLLQTVASFKRMRPFNTKYPCSKLVQMIQSSPTSPKLVEITTQELNGTPTFYIRRVIKLEEANRIGASDRCVYAKGFLSEEDLAKSEPSGLQASLENWAKRWGPIAVLRMRRDTPPKGQKDNTSREKKWKNSVFIEYQKPGSAEKLVSEFKQESGKPQFNGRELSSIMFKIDYVSMKAKEKGLPPPKMSGNRKAGQLPSVSHRSFGGNNPLFNAFRELDAIAAGKKQYAGTPVSSKKEASSKEEGEKFLEYEGNKLSVNDDGSLKNPEELKTFRSNVALGFELQGEAPTDQREARVNFVDLKKDLSIGEIVCHTVHLAADNNSKGTVAFNQPISDEMLAEIQAKGIRTGGRSVNFMRLSDEETKQHHLDSAIFKAKSMYGPKDSNNYRNHKGNRGDRNRRGGGQGGRGGGNGHQGGRRGNDRNREKEKNGQNESNADDGNKSNATPNVNSNKRDAEGNAVSANGAHNPGDAVPEIGRAQKKAKTS